MECDVDAKCNGVNFSLFWVLTFPPSERFARGDMIRAKIREQKWVTGEKQPEYEILEVLEHVEAYQQAHLPGMGGKGEAGE